MTISWDEYFFGIADAVAQKSRCLSQKVAAIAVRDDKFIVATGYNGPPMRHPHCDDKQYREWLLEKYETGGVVYRDVNEVGEMINSVRVCPRRLMGFKSGGGLQYCPAAHAERNVLIEAARLGIALEGCVLYLTCSWPCRECAKEMVNAGITEVVVTGDEEYDMVGGLTGRDILGVCGVGMRIGR